MCVKSTFHSIGITCIIVFHFFSFAVTIGDEASAYTPRSPVYIDGNGNFTIGNGVTSGIGTLLDPYVIEGWEINASFGHGIEIRNTDAHFVIRNVYVHSGWRGGWPSYDGIYLHNVSHGRFDNTTLTGNVEGILLELSTKNLIANTVIASNEADGVRLLNSDNNTVTNTSMSSNRNGIYVESSRNISLSNNTMYQNGVLIRGPLLEYWNTHEMDASNTVNGAPLYYWKNRTSGTIPSAVGQVILANCTGVVVENQSILNSSGAVHIGFSSDNIIANNVVSSFYGDGIYLYSSHNNTIADNTASSNGASGIRLEYSNHTIITGNVLDSNKWYGIYLSYSDDNAIDNNTIRDSGWGILLWFSDSNAISSNLAEDHRWDGISLHYANYNSINNNAIYSNWAGVSLWHCDYDAITNNTMFANDRSGIDLS
ncbi:MAG: right-handed parallel beta-helix repeat-containing protein, partial [Thermoplasmata archaeon]|nr:right-handed parallel beta-helix repeat-containing protein [Thermoplasmata archaeon]